MSNPITVTVELCAEDRARLDKIFEALTAHNCSSCAKSVAEYTSQFVAQSAARAGADEAADEQPTVDTPVAEVPENGQEMPKAEDKPEAPQVSTSDIQRKVVELSSAGKKAEVREIVKAYADKVSTIPEDKLGEVWQKLTALEG